MLIYSKYRKIQVFFNKSCLVVAYRKMGKTSILAVVLQMVLDSTRSLSHHNTLIKKLAVQSSLSKHLNRNLRQRKKNSKKDTQQFAESQKHLAAAGVRASGATTHSDISRRWSTLSYNFYVLVRSILLALRN